MNQVSTQEKYSRNAQKKDESTDCQSQDSNTLSEIAKWIITPNVRETHSEDYFITSWQDVYRDEPNFTQETNKPLYIDDVALHFVDENSPSALLFDTSHCPPPVVFSPRPLFSMTPEPTTRVDFNQFTSVDFQLMSDLADILPVRDKNIMLEAFQGLDVNSSDLRPIVSHRPFYGEIPVIFLHPGAVSMSMHRLQPSHVTFQRVNLFAALNRAQFFTLIIVTMVTDLQAQSERFLSFPAKFFFIWQAVETRSAKYTAIYKRVANLFASSIVDLRTDDTQASLEEFNPFSQGFGTKQRIAQFSTTHGCSAAMPLGMFLFLSKVVATEGADAVFKEVANYPGPNFMLYVICLFSVFLFGFLDAPLFGVHTVLFALICCANGVEAAIPVHNFAPEQVELPRQASALMTLVMCTAMIFFFLIVECPLSKKIFSRVDSFIVRKMERKRDTSALAVAVLDARKTLTEMYADGELHVEGLDCNATVECVPCAVPGEPIVKRKQRLLWCYRILVEFRLTLLALFLYRKMCSVGMVVPSTHMGVLIICVTSMDLCRKWELRYLEPLDELCTDFRDTVWAAIRHRLSKLPFIPITHPAVSKGKYLGRSAEGDGSIAPSDASTATMESDVSVEKIKCKVWIDEEIKVDIPHGDGIAFAKSFGTKMFDSPGFEFLAGDNITMDCIHFMRQIWLGPTLKEHGKLRCSVYYAMTIQQFVGGLIRRNKPIAAQAVDSILASLQVTLGIEEDGEAKTKVPTWLENIQESISSLASIEKSSLHEGITGFFSLIAVTPIFFYEIGTSASYIDAYKSCVKYMRKGGISVNAIVTFMLKTSSAVYAASKTGNLRGVMTALIQPDTSAAEFIEVADLVKKMKAGLISPIYEDVKKVCDRTRALHKRYKNLVQSGRATGIEEARYKEILQLVTIIHLLLQARGSKPEPYACFLVGKAGIGKSVFMDWLIKNTARRYNREDCQLTGRVDLASSYDDDTTSCTTDVIFDDLLNLKAEHRKRTCEEMNLKAVNTYCNPMQKADLPDKGAHFWMNEAKWQIENNCPPPDATLEPSSYYRRLGYCVEMSILREFSDGNGRCAKGMEIPSCGSHCQYRRWEMFDTGNGVWTKRYISEWLSYREFLVDFYAYVDNHISHERDMMRRRQTGRNLEMCPCRVLPADQCDCPMNLRVRAERMEEMTANEGEPEEDVSVLSVGELSSNLEAESFLPGSSWLSNVQRSEPTIIQGLGAWIYLRMLGDGFLSKAIATAWKLRLVELFSLFVTLFCVGLTARARTTTELVFSTAIGIYFFWFNLMAISLRRQMSNILALAPADVLGVYTSFLTQRLSGLVNVQALSNSLLVMVGSALTTVAIKSLINHLFPEAEPIAAGEVAVNLVAEDESNNNKVVLLSEIPTMVVSSSKLPWVQPTRKKPSAHHAAKTISEVDMEAKLTRSTFAARLRYDGSQTDDKHLLLLMLNSSLAMTTSHNFIDHGRFKKGVLTILDHQRAGRTVSLAYTFADMVVLKDRDVVLLHLANFPLGMLPDLRRFFCISRGEGQVFLKQVFRELRGECKAESRDMSGDWMEQPIRYEANGLNLVAKDVIRTTTNFPTQAGMCGSAYMRVDAPRVIVGIHILGNKTGKNGTGVVATITRGDIESAEEELRSACGYLAPLEHGPFSTCVNGFKQTVTDGHDKQNPTNFVHDGLVETFGIVPVLRSPTTALKLNPHYENARKFLMLKHEKMPPRMRFRRSYGKVARTTIPMIQPVDNHKLTIATKMYAAKICDLVTETKAKYPDLPLDRKLTWKETLNGILGTPLGRTKMASSAGAPSYLPKKFFYDEDDEGVLDFTPETAISVNNALDRLLAGFDTGCVNDACLKDEMVKMSKLYLARTFSVVNLNEFLISSRYLGALMQIWRINPGQSETAIGLNRAGPEWESFCAGFYLPNFVNNNFDADAKEYDMHQSPQLKSRSGLAFAIVAERAGWSKEEVQELLKVVALPVAPLVNLGGTIVALWNLFMSGIFWTALGNGATASIMMRYDYLLYCEETGFSGDFDDHYKIGTLGDDLRAAVSDEYRAHGWTPAHLAETCLKFGLTITNADKSGPPDFMHADKIEFLKSYLHYHEATGMNVSVVGPSSYMKAYHYHLVSPNLSPDEYQVDIGRNALLEAYWGGRSCYLTVQKRLIQYFRASGLSSFDGLTASYEERTELELGKIGGYQNQKPLTSVRELGSRLLAEYDSKDDMWDDTTEFPTEESAFAEADKEVLNYLQALRAKPEVVEASSEFLRIESEESPPTGEDIHGVMNIDQSPNEVVASEGTEHLLRNLPLDPATVAENILHRRQQMASFSWTNDQIGNSNDKMEFSPWLMLSQVPMINSRLMNVAGYKANVIVTFQLNAPATVSGMLIATVTHYPENSILGDMVVSTRNQDICAWSQRQHIRMIAGNGDGTFKLKVPFFHRTNFIHVSDTEMMALLPRVHVAVVSPLASSLDLTPTLNVAVFMEFADLTTYGATTAMSAGPGEYLYFGNQLKAEGEENPREGRISQAATALSRGMNEISRIPGLGGLATPAQIVGALGAIAHQHGFSKPALTAESPFNPSTIGGMANIRGSVGTKVISPDPAQNVSVGGVHMGIDTDEMELAYFTQRYSIVAVANINTMMRAGNQVYSQNVTPAVFVAGNGKYLQPASCAVPTLHFNHWMGAMQYRFTVVAPTNISGWLVVHYDPLTFKHADAGQTVDYINSTESVLINLAETREFEVEVNWGSALPALTTLGPIADIGTQWSQDEKGQTDLHNGTIRVSIHQPLLTSQGSQIELKLVVETRCGSNIRFFDYHGGQLSGEIKMPGIVAGATPSNVQATDVLWNYPVGLNSKCVSMPVCAEDVLTTAMLAPPRPRSTDGPTEITTGKPTAKPSFLSTMMPSLFPTSQAPTSGEPTAVPTTEQPTRLPTKLPTQSPTWKPSVEPSTVAPTLPPTQPPTTVAPTEPPTLPPTQVPTPLPTAPPTAVPTRLPTGAPTPVPSSNPSAKPSLKPTAKPSAPPTMLPTSKPTGIPTTAPVGVPPTAAPTIAVCEDRGLVDVGVHPFAISSLGSTYLQITDENLGANLILAGQPQGSYVLELYSVGSKGYRKGKFSGTTLTNIENADGPVPINPTTKGFVLDVNEIGACTGCILMEDVWVEDPAVPVKITVGTNQLPTNAAWAWFQTPGPYTFPASAFAPFTDGGRKGYTGAWANDAITTQALSVLNGIPWIMQVPVVFVFQGNLQLLWTERGASRSSTITSEHPTRLISKVLLITADMSSIRFTASGGVLGYWMIRKTSRRLEAEGDDGPAENKYFRMGKFVDTEDVLPVLAGEQLTSYRSLLKIGIPYAEYRLAASGGSLAKAAITDDMYAAGQSSKTFSLYSYLMRCYTCRRGGLNFYYHLRGDGSIECSRFYPGSDAEGSGRGGTEVIDSRVNPTGCVKFPYSSPFLFDYAFWTPGSCPHRHLDITAWNGPLSVKETMFVSEDFSFFNFRGAGLIQIP